MKKLYTLTFLAFLTLSISSAQCPTLVWNDEFDGTQLDTSKWEPMIGDGCTYGICGWGNNELQYYKAENAVVSNGTLKIIAKKERVRNKAYTSARLRTKGLADFTFGRFEARVKLLTGQGLWPAFWMLSTNEPYGGWPQSGEIDIMEFLGQNPEEAFGTIHYGDPYPNNQFQGSDYKKYDGSSFDQDFHVFAIEWEPGVIRWYVDDVLYQTKTSADVAPYNWPFDAGNQMHFLLNLAVGGNLPGSPDSTTPFPNQMEVDYVRVYDNGFHPSVSGDRLVPYQAQGKTYTINNAPSGSSFNWTVPTGATIVSGAGSSSITVDWGATGGTITADVVTNCISKQYSIDISVEPNYLYDFSFENFDAPANLTLNLATGTLTEVSNPDTSGINTSALSAEYLRNSQEQFDVIAYSTASIADADRYADRSVKFYMDVLTQAPIGTEIIVQLENSGTATPSNYPAGRHSRYVGKITQNGSWHRVAFDFLDQPDASTNPTSVDQIIILFASNSFNGDTYHWDNFDSYNADDGSGNNNNAPTANFTFTTTDLMASFDGSTSSDSDGSIVSYAWDFGDTTSGNGALVSHTYTAAADYMVTLTVTDNEGATNSVTQTVTVTDGNTGNPTSIHVQAITTGTVSAGRGSKRGTATIAVHDDLENPVANVSVTGTFSGTFSETVSGVTAADGSVTLTTTSTAKGGVTVDFCVDNLSHSTLPYTSSQNDISCTNISGTSFKATLLNQQNVPLFPSIFALPNLVQEEVELMINAPDSGNLKYQLYNIMGQLILSSEKNIRRGGSKLNLDFSPLPQGWYILKSQLNNDVFVEKVFKE